MSAEHRWATCGAMALTGEPGDAPLFPFTAAAAVAARSTGLFGLDEGVLSERAALRGLRRRGMLSAGGASRLFRAADGWLCLSLPRASDLELLPALVGVEADDREQAWSLLGPVVAQRPAAEITERATLLSMACSTVAETPRRRDDIPFPVGPVDLHGSLVVDLSSLWAGPLCAHLLQTLGARVIKVEDRRRLDGGRFGDRIHYDLLNGGKQSLVLDFSSSNDRRVLDELIERADVVVTSARSRALEQLGLDVAERIERAVPLVWVAITAHGWHSNRVGFGDDAAAAAGLVAWLPTSETPVFAGDAIADPLCGLDAAVRALRALQSGRSALIDASLVGAASSVAPHEILPARRATPADGGGWSFAGERVVVPPPRRADMQAAQPGADNDAVMAVLR